MKHVRHILCSAKDCNIKVFTTEQIVARMSEVSHQSVRAPVSFANKIRQIGGTYISNAGQHAGEQQSRHVLK